MKRFVFFKIHLFILFLHMCMFPAYCFHQRTYIAHSLVNGVLNETWTHSCLQFEWFSVGYGFISRSSSLFFRVRFTLVSFTPHWYLICFCHVYVCVCALEWFWISLTVIFPLCVCECVSWGVLCVCVCVVV